MVAKMSKPDVQQYLDLAHDDLRAASDNLNLGHLRVAISRAYYAMFYASTALLGSQRIWRSKHQGVIAALGEYFVKPGLIEAEYGRIFSDAFHARLDSDYTAYPSPDIDTAQQMVEKAQIFVERVTQLLAEIEADDKANDTPNE